MPANLNPKLHLLNPEKPNATLVLTDGTTRIIQPKNKHDFKLEELYTLLNCETIEVVYSCALAEPQSNHDHILIIDEEGKLKHRPKNELATKWYSQESDFIVGDAILCHTSMLE